MNAELVSSLLRGCAQGTLVAAMVFVAGKLFPRVPARVRAWAYWLVCLKFLLAPLPFAVSLALLPSHAASVASAPVAQVGHTVLHASRAWLEAAPVAAEPVFSWTRLFWALWMVGAAVAIERLVVQHRAVRELARATTPVADPRLQATLARLVDGVGLARRPLLLASNAVTAPLVTGLFRPRIVFPRSALEDLRGESLEMALAHELSHLKHHDLWLAWVPALAEVLLWFFPVVRLCAREFAQAREEACDAEAVALTGVTPADYGELLLAYGTSAKPIAASAACAASPRFHHLRRRLIMLQHFSSRRLGRAWLFGAPLLALSLLPFRVVAQSAPQPPPPPAVPVPPAPPVPGTAAVAPVPPVPPSAFGEPAPFPPPVPGVPLPPSHVRPAFSSTPPAPPQLAMADHDDDDNVTNIDDDRNDDGFRYVLVHGDNASMSGTTDDLRHARDFRGKFGDHFLWVRTNGHEYILKDDAALKPLEGLSEQQNKLGEQQNKLGEQQSKLGEQQGKWGEQQEKLGEQQRDLGIEMSKLSVREQELDRDADRASSDDQRAKIEAELKKVEQQMNELEKKMNGLGDQMNEFGRHQGDLGRQQGELGRQQGQLGREQGRIAREFERQLKQIAEKQIASGHATKVD